MMEGRMGDVSGPRDCGLTPQYLLASVSRVVKVMMSRWLFERKVDGRWLSSGGLVCRIEGLERGNGQGRRGWSNGDKARDFGRRGSGRLHTRTGHAVVRNRTGVQWRMVEGWPSM